MTEWLIPSGKAGWARAGIRLLLVGVVLMAIPFSMTRMPGRSFSGPLPKGTPAEQAIAAHLRRHVEELAGRIGERNLWHPSTLRASEAYLTRTFTDMGYQVSRQEYLSYQVKVANLEVTVPGRDPAAPMLVVGAHYDTVPGSPGANDNGSGVAVLLELARLLRRHQPAASIRLVAFVNEEPPFYYSREMGSYRYASRCRKRGEKLRGMLSLETMGCYSEEPGSQHYPFPFGLFYPDTADFIALVGNLGSRELVRQATASFRRHGRFPSEGLTAPELVPGVGWSDHWSFWQHGYQALMVTDTAFFRSSNYHTPADTPETLDYQRLARVTAILAPMLLDLAAGPADNRS